MTERHFDRASERAALDRWITDAEWDHLPASLRATLDPGSVESGDTFEDEEDQCPAGGPHVWTNESWHPNRMYDRQYHCDHCGASAPPEEKDYP